MAGANESDKFCLFAFAPGTFGFSLFALFSSRVSHPYIYIYIFVHFGASAVFFLLHYLALWFDVDPAHWCCPTSLIVLRRCLPLLLVRGPFRKVPGYQHRPLE